MVGDEGAEESEHRTKGRKRESRNRMLNYNLPFLYNYYAQKGYKRKGKLVGNF